VGTLNAANAASSWGIVVTAFGLGMGLGMGGANQAVKLVEREVAFVWSMVASPALAKVTVPRPGRCRHRGDVRLAGLVVVPVDRGHRLILLCGRGRCRWRVSCWMHGGLG